MLVSLEIDLMCVCFVQKNTMQLVEKNSTNEQNLGYDRKAVNGSQELDI